MATWQERDNFETEEQARNYIRGLRKHGGYTKTRYRIRHSGKRYHVDFMPGGESKFIHESKLEGMR